MSTKHIERVAIVGATGRIGGAFAEALVGTGKHTVTALQRPESKGELPAGVKTVPVNFDKEDSIVNALKGQQFLVITLSVRAPPDLHSRIVQAAAKAGIQWIMPNAYGSDWKTESLIGEDMVSEASRDKVQEIEKLGINWITLACGFWYEWSLALGEPFFGIDIKNRKATILDDGNAARPYSTWPQCGRALAALLSLPESGASPCVSDWKDKILYISSFRPTQHEMLESVHRVLGDSDKDWEITSEPTGSRYKRSVEEMKTGSQEGFGRAMYTRTFFPAGDSDFETTRGLDNDKLGLKKEDLDSRTKVAVEMVRSGWNPWA